MNILLLNLIKTLENVFKKLKEKIIMKRLTFCIVVIFMLFTSMTNAQENVGIGTENPDASALLHLNATDKGLLIPRVQLVGIANGDAPINEPANGLLVYHTGENGIEMGFYYWDGHQWVRVGTGAGDNQCIKLQDAYDCDPPDEGRVIIANHGPVDIQTNNSGKALSAISVANSTPIGESEIDLTSAAYFEHGALGSAVIAKSSNPDNILPNIYVTTNGKGEAIYVESTNTSDSASTIVAVHAGVASAIEGHELNPGSSQPAIYASSKSNVHPSIENNVEYIGGSALEAYYHGTGNGVAIWAEAKDPTSQAVAAIIGKNVSSRADSYGIKAHGANGVNGQASTGFGVRGFSEAGVGVSGISNSGSKNRPGVQGQSYTNNGVGVFGSGLYSGVYGQSASMGEDEQLYPNPSGWAAYFDGDVRVTGQIYKNICDFLIPHPTKSDKLLKHTCIESPMPVNMYRGNAVCDAHGEAVVELPEYFKEININFSYNLTPVGSFANVYVKKEIEGNTFVIAGGNPGMKVSWTVYADRYDEYVRTHPETRIDIIDREGKFADWGKESSQGAVLQLLDTPSKGIQRAAKLSNPERAQFLQPKTTAAESLKLKNVNK